MISEAGGNNSPADAKKLHQQSNEVSNYNKNGSSFSRDKCFIPFHKFGNKLFLQTIMSGNFDSIVTVPTIHFKCE